MKRVCIIGLDCLSPDLVFERYWKKLPNVRRLAERGAYGRLCSTIPPITVPAWASMVTGRDPGELGLYGFHDRADFSYDKKVLPTSHRLTAPTLWTLLSAKGFNSKILSVPPTYPPLPLQGQLVSDFLTPEGAAFTFPPSLQEDIRRNVGEYIFDVHDFRNTPREQLLNDIKRMSEQRFAVAAHMLQPNDWDFFMMVDMSPDRLHHGFWRYGAVDHPAYDPQHPWANVLLQFYESLDARVGVLLNMLRDDDVVFVVSDHGAKTMLGGFALNQWLIERGDLVLLPSHPRSGNLDPHHVDWRRTKAWGEGGYIARIYLNIRDREPLGLLNTTEVDAYRRELCAELLEIKSPTGSAWRTRVFFPSDTYRAAVGVPPDLQVYWDDLRYRAIGSLGHPSVYVSSNDRGLDDANHAQDGVFICSDPAQKRHSRAYDILEIAPLVLSYFGLTSDR